MQHNDHRALYDSIVTPQMRESAQYSPNIMTSYSTYNTSDSFGEIASGESPMNLTTQINQHPFTQSKIDFRGSSLSTLSTSQSTSLNRAVRRTLKIRNRQRKPCRCVVCGERASGMYFGAMVCLPCKSFFIRCTKDGQPQLTCLGDRKCSIDRTNRMRCQYCRYQRCLNAGMMRREKPEVVEPGEGQELCRVCADIANGIHFGVTTCEGCKKFFRRALKEADTYECKFHHACALNPRNRNACRLCRYKKCLTVGMSRQAIRMGRPKKLKSEASNTFDTNFPFDQQSMFYYDAQTEDFQPQTNNQTISMTSSMNVYQPSSPYYVCANMGGNYSNVGNMMMTRVPHSPCSGTDSGIESDRGSPVAHSPVGSPSFYTPLSSPSCQKNLTFTQHIHNNCHSAHPSSCNQTTHFNSTSHHQNMQSPTGSCISPIDIKSEPIDSQSLEYALPSSTQGEGTTGMVCLEVKLKVPTDASVVSVQEELDFEEINDMLASLGQQLNGFNQSTDDSSCTYVHNAIANFEQEFPVQKPVLSYGQETSTLQTPMRDRMAQNNNDISPMSTGHTTKQQSTVFPYQSKYCRQSYPNFHQYNSEQNGFQQRWENMQPYSSYQTSVYSQNSQVYMQNNNGSQLFAKYSC